MLCSVNAQSEEFFSTSETQLSEPTFSEASGFFTSSFMLQISHEDPDVQILYTLDGSEPKEENIGGATYSYKNQYPLEYGGEVGPFLTKSISTLVYSNPFLIDDNTSSPNKISTISTTYDDPTYFPDYLLPKAKVVRAKAIKDGASPSKVVSRTYFVSTEDGFNSNLPIISISANEPDLFDFNDGINVPGIDFETWRNNSVDGLNKFGHANYTRRGSDHEIPVHFSYFVGQNEVLSQLLGLRIHGGESRIYPNKSFRFYARNSYSTNVMDYPFFGPTLNQNYRRLILRTTGQDNFQAFIRDPFMHTAFQNLNFEIQEKQPSLVYLNGEFWGMHYIRERYGKQYFEQYYQIDEEDLDYLSDEYEEKEGDNLDYLDLLAYLENNDLSEDTNFQALHERIDFENLIDYYIANIYVGNTDWPRNNIDYYRFRTAYNPDAPYPKDGRWRWIAKDMDFGLRGQNLNANHIDFSLEENGPNWPNPPWSTFLFRKLMENDGFRMQFATRYIDLLNTTFKEEHLLPIFDAIKQEIEPEIQSQIDRWKTLGSYAEWQNEIAVIINFIEARPSIAKQHVVSEFNLDNEISVNLNLADADAGWIELNSIAIHESTDGIFEDYANWSGFYFENLPMTLQAKPQPGYAFSHWSGDINSTEETLEVTPTEDLNITAHFETFVEPIALHFWMMDTQISNNTPLQVLAPTFSAENTTANIVFESCLDGYPFSEAHPNWRKASMERRNRPTSINYFPEYNNQLQFGQANMRGLQVRQPMSSGQAENTVVFEVDASAYQITKFSFAVKDEDAANSLSIAYFDEETNAWSTQNLVTSDLNLQTDQYQLVEVDLSEVEAADTNPNFQLRIRFNEGVIGADDGNRVTFNNILFEGFSTLSASDFQQSSQKIILFPNPTTDSLQVNGIDPGFEYEVYNLQGKLLAKDKSSDSNISLSDFENGLYLVIIHNDGVKHTKRIIKN